MVAVVAAFNVDQVQGPGGLRELPVRPLVHDGGNCYECSLACHLMILYKWLHVC